MPSPDDTHTGNYLVFSNVWLGLHLMPAAISQSSASTAERPDYRRADEAMAKRCVAAIGPSGEPSGHGSQTHLVGANDGGRKGGSGHWTIPWGPSGVY